MIEKYIEFIKQYSPPQEGEVEFIQENVPIRTHARNEVIFEAGKISDTIYFVLDGCIRLFYNADGNDKTAFFYTEGKFICAGESYTFCKPAIENYQAIEESIVMHFKRETVNEILKRFPNFELVARYAVEGELISSQKMIASFITKSPEERYKELLSTHRELFLRVPQQYIASYLGVSPETLSRIKKRVIEKERSGD